jgi:UDP-N-acetyl-2-amino-2-deoxyglucuronate dehydrogenase
VKAGGKSVNIIEEWNFADNLDNADSIKMKYNENPPNVYGYGHSPLYTDVIDAIINCRVPYIDAYAGRRALELVLAIYKAAQTGMRVELPLKSCSTIDFKGRF